MNYVSSLFLVFICVACIYDVSTQVAKLPSRFKSNGDRIKLPETKDVDLNDFLGGPLDTEGLMSIKLPNCKFVAGNINGIVFKNRITTRAKMPHTIKYIVYKSSIEILIQLVPLIVEGRVRQTVSSLTSPTFRPADYTARISGVSCALIYSRITSKVVFCRCRVNEVTSLMFRITPDKIPRNTSNSTLHRVTSNNTTLPGLKDNKSSVYDKIKNCIKYILRYGICRYLKTEIYRRKDELEKILS